MKHAISGSEAHFFGGGVVVVTYRSVRSRRRAGAGGESEHVDTVEARGAAWKRLNRSIRALFDMDKRCVMGTEDRDVDLRTDLDRIPRSIRPIQSTPVLLSTIGSTPPPRSTRRSSPSFFWTDTYVQKKGGVRRAPWIRRGRRRLRFEALGAAQVEGGPSVSGHTLDESRAGQGQVGWVCVRLDRTRGCRY